MRCSCPECGTYMIQAESMHLGCVCPECGARCKACLGTDTVISRETLKELKTSTWFTPDFNAKPPAADEADDSASDDDLLYRHSANKW